MSEREPWPLLEYDDDGYPEGEGEPEWMPIPAALDLSLAAEWLLAVLPNAAENMPCFCDVEDGTDCLDRPVKRISFSTGGWSGAEAIVGLIERRFDLSHFMESWKRGGHYVFEIPLRYLARTPSTTLLQETER